MASRKASILEAKQTMLKKTKTQAIRSSLKQNSTHIEQISIPVLELEEFEPPVVEASGVRNTTTGSRQYALIGLGKSGIKISKAFYDLGYHKALAIATSPTQLLSLNIPDTQKLLIYSRSRDNSDSAGKSEKLIQRNQQRILHHADRIFGDGLDHIMICVEAGCTTTADNIVKLIEVAKKYTRYIGRKNASRSVGVVMSMPNHGKNASQTMMANAHKTAQLLCEMAQLKEISPLIIVDDKNAEKTKSSKKTQKSFPGLNNTFTGHFDLFNRLSNLPSPYTSFDPADYASIIRAGGCAVMGLAEVDCIDDRFSISEALADNLDRSFYARGFDLSTAGAAGCIVVGGKKMMANVRGLQRNIDYAFDLLANITGNATIHRGIYEDNIESLRIYTIIGGLATPTARINVLKK